jgi:hypothetical protein
MQGGMTTEPRPAPNWNAAALAGVLLVILLLVGIGLYTSPLLSSNGHYWGLILIGILAYVLAIVAFLMAAMTRSAQLSRAAGWALLAFAFVTLLGTDLLAPDSAFGGAPNSITLNGGRLLALLAVLILLAISLAFMAYQRTGRDQVAAREARRLAWRQGLAADREAASSPSSPAPATRPNPPQGGGPGP